MKLDQELISRLGRIAALNELEVDRFVDEKRVRQGMRGPFVAEVDGIPRHLGAYQHFVIDPETQEISLVGFNDPSRERDMRYGEPISIDVSGDEVVMVTSDSGVRYRLKFRPFDETDWEWVDPDDDTDQDWEAMVASIAEHYRAVDAGEDFSLPADDEDEDDEEEDED